jgi:hypothetical protein
LTSDPKKRPPITEHPDLLEMDLDGTFDDIRRARALGYKIGRVIPYVVTGCVAVYAIQKRRHKKEKARGSRPPVQ